MKRLLNVYKPQGLTPLQTIDLVRKKIPELTKEKIGFVPQYDIKTGIKDYFDSGFLIKK